MAIEHSGHLSTTCMHFKNIWHFGGISRRVKRKFQNFTHCVGFHSLLLLASGISQKLGPSSLSRLHQKLHTKSRFSYAGCRCQNVQTCTFLETVFDAYSCRIFGKSFPSCLLSLHKFQVWRNVTALRRRSTQQVRYGSFWCPKIVHSSSCCVLLGPTFLFIFVKKLSCVKKETFALPWSICGKSFFLLALSSVSDFQSQLTLVTTSISSCINTIYVKKKLNARPELLRHWQGQKSDHTDNRRMQERETS